MALIKSINKEWTVIVVAWVLIYAADPLYMYYAHIVSQLDFQWEKILELWTITTIFFALFLLHHFILAPMLVEKKKVKVYIAGVVACLALFISFLLLQVPEKNKHRDHGLSPFLPQVLHNEERNTDQDFRPHKHERRKEIHSRGLLLTPPDLARVIMLLMLMGADLGAVAWLYDQKMRQRLLLLEQQALAQELTHLRYQINPHFFMNTLNNIHVLIDFDQERAKRSIIELSGLMRYSLYEGNEVLIPLQHEVEFLKQYISLMKLRFSNKVELTYDFPEQTPAEVMMPPLLFATFIENAFKHGISYQEPSFIKIRLWVEDTDKTIHFTCQNSRHKKASATEDGHHGIGLANVRKRLELQYGNQCQLDIDESDDKLFTVNLVLPKNKA